MKVLFALNNDNVSNAIIKKYQKQYKEIISYKNVYYFNAILKELQKDKTYDRVVISEDLEPFANNDYDTIDKFIFEKLDKISDEATKQNGDDIEIILICSDRINKGDSVLVKFFGIGIYNAIIGNDRQVETVCSLINQPRTKKEAKIYYKIESNSVSYQSENENSVNETEVQNILAHYKRLGKNEDKYVDSFNTIVAQYTDEQLKVIIKCLPLHVRAVLEERSPKYQELATFSNNSNGKVILNQYNNKNGASKKGKITSKMLDDESGKTKITKPIVIPSSLKGKELKEIRENRHVEEKEKSLDEDAYKELSPDEVEMPEIELPEFTQEVKEKRGRGRPRKIQEPAELEVSKPKRGRGRPRKEVKEEVVEEEQNDFDNFELPDVTINQETNDSDDINDTIDLFNIEDEETDNKAENNISDIDSDNNKNSNDDEVFDLFNLEDSEENNENGSEDTIDLFGIGNQVENQNDFSNNDEVINRPLPEINTEFSPEENHTDITNTDTHNVPEESSSLITGDTKVVCFVGTTKNGTSFLVNNVAQLLSEMNIPTAILDMTKSRNAYYIYTKNDESLRNIAVQSIKKLEQGFANGIVVNKKLTVYTSLPEEDYEVTDVNTVISTLTGKHNVVLIDCDFNTNPQFFEKAQEIYLVQTQDVLTIQPFTAFLRNLKSKNILRQEKLKIIINKEQKIKGLTDKILIGGLAYYNDPGMAFMTELFNKDKVMYCKIPFELQNYSKYLSSMVNCSISLNGYTKQMINALHGLSAMVYPLINKPKYSPRGYKKNDKQDIFSSEVNNTLNKMKNNY